VEDNGNFILGPVSPKEYKDMVVELNGSRTNRVFEFFMVTTLERLGASRGSREESCCACRHRSRCRGDSDVATRRRRTVEENQ
jgi:hypothetical protein